MASIVRRKKSRFWTACYTNREGRQLKRSTKTTDKRQAMQIALELERVERQANAGAMTTIQLRKVLSDVSEKINGETLMAPSVEDYLDDWLKGVTARNRAATIERYGKTVRLFLSGLGEKAKKPVTALTPHDIEMFLNRRLDAGFAPQTAIIDLKTLNSAFRRAENYGVILKNPVVAVRPPKCIRSQREVFKHEEVQELLNAVPALEWQTLILLGYFTGARLGDCVHMMTNATSLLQQSFGYDAASRLTNVLDTINNNSATYSYLTNSPLVSQITFKSNSVTRMTTTKQYDYLNRLTAISNGPSAGVPVSFNYSYNSANQRVQNTLVDNSYWIYQYDSLGQVISGNKYWYDGTMVAGQQFGYTFDTIGNRTQTMSGGDSTGANLRTANYYANNLNQLTNRVVPAYVDVKGVSIGTNVVTVNGQTAYRKGEYFRQELPANNSSSPLWTNIIVTATGQASVTGNVYVAQTPEVFKYDPDGNLTNDGRFVYVWDGENRLVGMTNNTGVGPKYGLTFAYDAKGRRIQKFVATNGVPVYTNRFLYDGWNLIATLTPSSQLQSAYMWGNDLSGSMQGAGGVGGLLEVSYYGTSTTNCFPVFDGNGNVAALVNAADSTVAASYEYGPFGEIVRNTGPMGKVNPIRFSTKYQDDESDLIMYPYRPYKGSTGTWLCKDPLGEPGFELVANRPNATKTSFGERVQIVIKFLQLTNPRLVERFKIHLAEDRRFSLSSSQNTGNLYDFVANTPINSQDAWGLESPSSGFECKGLTGARLICWCPYARISIIAGACNACWSDCNAWCVQEYLDDTITETEMDHCVTDCYKRELKCIQSGCKMAFN